MSSRAPGDSSEQKEVLELFECIANLQSDASGFNGVIVRSVSTRYATEKDLFSSAGAARSGGRWNRVGLPAIYASLDVITATYEAYQNFVKFGFPMTSIQRYRRSYGMPDAGVEFNGSNCFKKNRFYPI